MRASPSGAGFRGTTHGIPARRGVIRAEVGRRPAELVADPYRPSAWTLLIDDTAQSHVDLADPTHLEFEYVRRTGHLLDALAPRLAPLRVLHLGGGAWTLPRYVAATRPGSVQRVVELDGALVELVGAPAARRRAGTRRAGRRRPRRARGHRPGRGRPRAARRLRGRPHARAPDLGGVRGGRGARLPRRVPTPRTSPTAGARSRTRDFAGGRDRAALPPTSRSSRHRTCCTAAGSATSCWSPSAARAAAGRAAPVHRADPSPRGSAGADLGRFTAEARTDRTAVPSPVPPPGFWGRSEDAVRARLGDVRPGAPRTSPRSTTPRSVAAHEVLPRPLGRRQRGGDRVRPAAAIGVGGRPGLEVAVVRARLGPVAGLV